MLYSPLLELNLFSQVPCGIVAENSAYPVPALRFLPSFSWLLSRHFNIVNLFWLWLFVKQYTCWWCFLPKTGKLYPFFFCFVYRYLGWFEWCNIEYLDVINSNTFLWNIKFHYRRILYIVNSCTRSSVSDCSNVFYGLVHTQWCPAGQCSCCLGEWLMWCPIQSLRQMWMSFWPLLLWSKFVQPEVFICNV